MQHRAAKIFFLLLLLFEGSFSFGQQCINKFTSLIYKGISFDTFTHSIYTSTKEIFSIGNITRDHSFARKFSSKGTPLFYYQYTPIYQFNRTYFANLTFTDVFQSKDGSFLIAGKVIKDKYIGQLEFVNHIGVLLKVDTYGNVLWGKNFESAHAFNNNGFELSASNVVETSTGDIIIYLASYYGRNYPAYGRIVCFSSNGNEKWNTLLATNDYDGGLKSLTTKRKLLQAKDGSIIIGDVLYKSDRTGEPLLL